MRGMADRGLLHACLEVLVAGMSRGSGSAREGARSASRGGGLRRTLHLHKGQCDAACWTLQKGSHDVNLASLWSNGVHADAT